MAPSFSSGPKCRFGGSRRRRDNLDVILKESFGREEISSEIVNFTVQEVVVAVIAMRKREKKNLIIFVFSSTGSSGTYVPEHHKNDI